MKNAVIGEVHTWSNGERYKKTPQGWEHVEGENFHQKSITQKIMDKVEPYIQSIIDKVEQSMLEDDGKVMTDYDKRFKNSIRKSINYQI